MITKAKVDRIVAALEKKAAAHERESNVADTPEMQGYHMGAQDACELAVGMLEGLSSTGDGSVRFVDMLIDKSIKSIRCVKREKEYDGEEAERFSGFCKGRDFGGQMVESLICIADEPGEVDE